jgi:hypothetical protein
MQAAPASADSTMQLGELLQIATAAIELAFEECVVSFTCLPALLVIPRSAPKYS